MRGFLVIGAGFAALILGSPARAAEANTPDTTVAVTTFTPQHFQAMASGLRQSLADTGISQALSRAGDWVKELELHWAAHRNGKAAPGLDIDPGPDPLAPNATLPAAPIAMRAHHFDLGLVSLGTGGAGSQVWTLGHAPPLAALAPAGSTANLASHDVELGLHVPALPWNAAIAGDRYWWGERGRGPQVEGSRVGLKLTPGDNIEIEGGRAEDTRGSGGFVGVLYHVTLDPTP